MGFLDDIERKLQESKMGGTPPKAEAAAGAAEPQGKSSAEQHEDIRYMVEFRLLPRLMAQDPAQMMRTVQDRGPAAILGLYDLAYEEEALEVPYTEDEVRVHAFAVVGDIGYIRVDMPQRYVRMPLCQRIYFTFDRAAKTGKCFMVETSVNGNILGSMEDENHANYGAVQPEDEVNLILEILGSKAEGFSLEQQ